MDFLNYNFCMLVLCNSLQRHECTSMKTVYANTNAIVIVRIFVTIKHAHYIIITNLVWLSMKLLHTKLLWYSQYCKLVFKCEQSYG